MVGALGEVAVQDGHQIVPALIIVLAQSLGDDGEGVGYSILAHGPVGDLGHRVEGGQGAVLVPAVHGVGAGGEGLSSLAAIGGGAGLLAVHHVGGDGESGEGVDTVPIQGMLFQLGGEVGDDLHGDVVHPVIVVAILGEVALHGKVHSDAVFVPDGLHLGKFDGGEGVGGDGKPGYAEGGQPLHQGVVEGHLAALIGVLVVHVVDDVDGVHVELGHIGEDLFVVAQYLGVVQHLVHVVLDAGDDDAALLLVHAAIDGVEEAFGQIGPGAEELHLLAHRHGGHAACDAVVVTVHGPHELVALVLDGVGLNAHLGAVVLERLGQVFAPEDGEVGFGGGAQIGEGVEHTEGALGYQGAAVHTHTADGLGDPGGVAAEELVVLRGPQVAHQTQLDDELVDELLGALLVQDTIFQVPLEVDVQEGGDAAQGGGGTVVLLDARQVGHVEVLHRLAGVLGGAGDITAVLGGHGRHFLQGADLHLDLLPQADALVGHGAVQHVQVLFLLLNEKVGAVEGHPAVVTHDAATAIGIGQAGEKSGVAGQTGALRVGVEDALVVGLTVEAEVPLDLRVEPVAILLQSRGGVADAAEGVDDAL